MVFVTVAGGPSAWGRSILARMHDFSETRRFTSTVDGSEIVGMLRLPADRPARAPALVIDGPVHSEKTLAPNLARKFFAALSAPKAELWVDSEGQIDFYDRPERIEPGADRLAEHFRAHLGATR